MASYIHLKAIIHGEHVSLCMIAYFVACNMLLEVDNHSTWCNMLHATNNV